MRTVRRLVFASIARHVLLVALAFSALFFFIDFVDEVHDVGRDGYTLLDAVWTCTLMQGAHFYDLFPIALLIGGILALARMAQTSEFTILRTAGLGPGRALSLLGVLGVSAAALTVAVGNWLVPLCEQQLSIHKAHFGTRQGLSLGKGGTWLRERRDTGDGHYRHITVNVGSATSEGDFGAVRIFEFDDQGRLIRRLSAREARVDPTEATGPLNGADPKAEGGSVWHLRDVVDTHWQTRDLIGEQAVLEGSQLVTEIPLQNLDWHSSLTPLVVAASVLPPDTMSVFALWRYTQHLAVNAQAAQRYEIEFWQKLFYPLVCLVMVALSLPFAYLHARSGSMSLKIFGGIMLGISFVLANHIASHLGLLHNWQPWLAAATPSVFYLLLSLSAFVWLVRYR